MHVWVRLAELRRYRLNWVESPVPSCRASWTEAFWKIFGERRVSVEDLAGEEPGPT